MTLAETLIEQMLDLYGVRFTDGNSRQACIESWCRQFRAALGVLPAQHNSDEVVAHINAAKEAIQTWTLNTPTSYAQRNAIENFQYVLWVMMKQRIEELSAASANDLVCSRCGDVRENHGEYNFRASHEFVGVPPAAKETPVD